MESLHSGIYDSNAALYVMTSTLTTLGCVGKDIDTESEFVHSGRRFTIHEEEALISA